MGLFEWIIAILTTLAAISILGAFIYIRLRHVFVMAGIMWRNEEKRKETEAMAMEQSQLMEYTTAEQHGQSPFPG